MTWQDHFIALDTETSGFHPEARVLELAVVEFVAGEPAKHETFLFSPPDLNWEDPRVLKALEVNGLGKGDLQGCPPFEFLHDRVQECLGWAAVWVAHNAAFDLRMLDREFQRLDLSPKRPDAFVACTMSLDRFIDGHALNKLADVAGRRGVVAEGVAHRAHTDAVMAGRIFFDQAPWIPGDLHEARSFVQEAEKAWRQKRW